MYTLGDESDFVNLVDIFAIILEKEIGTNVSAFIFVSFCIWCTLYNQISRNLVCNVVCDVPKLVF